MTPDQMSQEIANAIFLACEQRRWRYTPGDPGSRYKDIAKQTADYEFFCYIFAVNRQQVCVKCGFFVSQHFLLIFFCVMASASAAIDGILNFKKDEEDFYAVLGCDESSSVEQITAEYKARALQYHPDKNAGDKEAELKFQKMKEAKETLCDPERKANYDKWRNSGLCISYKAWLARKEHVHQSMHWTTHKTKDRMLPEGPGSSAPRAASSGPPGAHRRASEGGANIHWGGRGNVQWDSTATSEVVNKFRNYEI